VTEEFEWFITIGWIWW